MSASIKNYVDVGVPSPSFEEWESAEVRFHGFKYLSRSVGEGIESPEFSCLGHQWTITLYPAGIDEFVDEDYMPDPVGISLNHCSGDEIHFIYQMNVNDATGSRLGHAFGGTTASDVDRDCASSKVFCSRSILRETALEQGTLTIEVKLKQNVDQEFIRFKPPNPFPSSGLKMLEDEECADVLFEVSASVPKTETVPSKNDDLTTKNKVFHAHRLILKQCAPTLYALCEPSAEMTPIPIHGVDPSVFNLLLQYVYGRVIPENELKSNTKEIIEASDRFGVVGLKLAAEMCYIRSTPYGIDNAVDVLLYADAKNCAFLKEMIMDFIVDRWDKFSDMQSFENVPGTLIPELLKAVGRREKKEPYLEWKPIDYATMRVNTLRKLCFEKGLDVDGSREALIKSLENAPDVEEN